MANQPKLCGTQNFHNRKLGKVSVLCSVSLCFDAFHFPEKLVQPFTGCSYHRIELNDYKRHFDQSDAQGNFKIILVTYIYMKYQKYTYNYLIIFLLRR